MATICSIHPSTHPFVHKRFLAGPERDSGDSPAAQVAAGSPPSRALQCQGDGCLRKGMALGKACVSLGNALTSLSVSFLVCVVEVISPQRV